MNIKLTQILNNTYRVNGLEDNEFNELLDQEIIGYTVGQANDIIAFVEESKIDELYNIVDNMRLNQVKNNTTIPEALDLEIEEHNEDFYLVKGLNEESREYFNNKKLVYTLELGNGAIRDYVLKKEYDLFKSLLDTDTKFENACEEIAKEMNSKDVVLESNNSNTSSFKVIKEDNSNTSSFKVIKEEDDDDGDGELVEMISEVKELINYNELDERIKTSEVYEYNEFLNKPIRDDTEIYETDKGFVIDNLSSELKKYLNGWLIKYDKKAHTSFIIKDKLAELLVKLNYYKFEQMNIDEDYNLTGLQSIIDRCELLRDYSLTNPYSKPEEDDDVEDCTIHLNADNYKKYDPNCKYSKVSDKSVFIGVFNPNSKEFDHNLVFHINKFGEISEYLTLHKDKWINELPNDIESIKDIELLDAFERYVNSKDLKDCMFNWINQEHVGTKIHLNDNYHLILVKE